MKKYENHIKDLKEQYNELIRQRSKAEHEHGFYNQIHKEKLESEKMKAEIKEL